MIFINAAATTQKVSNRPLSEFAASPVYHLAACTPLLAIKTLHGSSDNCRDSLLNSGKQRANYRLHPRAFLKATIVRKGRTIHPHVYSV